MATFVTDFNIHESVNYKQTNYSDQENKSSSGIIISIKITQSCQFYSIVDDVTGEIIHDIPAFNVSVFK